MEVLRVMMSRLTAVALIGGLWAGNLCLGDETTARAFLAERESTAYLQEGSFRIERVDADKHAAEGSIVFQTYINGLRLHGSRVIVVEEPDGTVQQVLHDSTQHLLLRQDDPGLALDQAVAAAEAMTPDEIASDADLVWFRLGREAILAWEVTTDLADSGRAASPTHLETVLDATTGAVLSQRQIDTKEYTPENAGGVFPRIVINNTIGAAGSRAYAAPFDAVVEVDFGCTGTLIADNVVLCARHCGVGAGDTIVFGDNAGGGGIFNATVQSSFLPAGSGSLLDGGDVSILTLTSAVPSNIAEPMRLIDETDALEGMLCATLGYGYNGLGSSGHGFSADGFRWGGENIIDVYGSPAGTSGSNIISTDFDDGSGGANTISGSSPTPVQFEATTAPGDSGGPVLVQFGSEWVIAGVLSGGTTSTSVYGDISWWTGTAVYRSAIEARGGVFVTGFEIALPNGVPDLVSPAGGDTLAVEIVPSPEDPVVPGSGTFHVDTGSGFQQVALSQDSGTTFTATFPASDCLTDIAFYVSFELQSGTMATLPSGAPGSSFSVLSADNDADTFSDSFDTNLGWAVSGNATDGQWERAIPNNGDRGDPAADAETIGGGFCFVTDNGNIPDTNTDVDGGSTILTSPVLDAAGGTDSTAFLSYYRWYSNDFGAAPNADTFVVEISNNGGSSWTTLETVGPTGAGTSGGWNLVEHRIEDTIVPTSNMRVRFTASDLGDGSVVEAGVDAVTIRLVSCDEELCVGDVDNDGDVDFDDLNTVLSSWDTTVAPFTSGDTDGDGDVDFDDLNAVLANWDTAC